MRPVSSVADQVGDRSRCCTPRSTTPRSVARFSLEAVANAFVMLGLLRAARAGEIGWL